MDRITTMDRGIGMDALITAGPQDIGECTITIDTGITATTTTDTGMAVKSGPEESITLNVRQGFPCLDVRYLFARPGNC
jgi:hypothetical protein